MLGGATDKSQYLKSVDNRYMWNYNLYKQLRMQKIPNYWMIPMIQGYVGHAKPTMEIDLILISRRRWLMGGTRYNARGIDDDGNCANFVESEQLVIKTKVNREKNIKRTYVYSYSQIRGSAPFHWNQHDGKVKIDRSIESSLELFLKHADSLHSDYESETFLIVNLLA